MEWELVTRGGNPVCEEVFIGVRRSGLKLSTAFEDAADIRHRNYGFVRIKRNNEHRCLLLEFISFAQYQKMKDQFDNTDGIYPLHPDGGSKPRNLRSRTGGSVINCGKVILDTEWLYLITKERQLASKRFRPEPTKLANEWILRCMNVFEDECRVDNPAIPAGMKGIYRFLDDKKNVLYIGQGLLRFRFESHMKEKEMNATHFQWACIGDHSTRLRAEAFHLDAFFKKNGKLPPHNLVAGHKDKALEVLQSLRKSRKSSATKIKHSE